MYMHLMLHGLVHSAAQFQLMESIVLQMQSKNMNLQNQAHHFG